MRHARRDDLGQFGQRGLLPPTATSFWRALLWKITGRSGAARRAFLATSGALPASATASGERRVAAL